MLTIYTRPSNASSRKAISWAIENEIEYQQVKTEKMQLTHDDILRFMQLSYTGTEDLISRHSKAFSIFKDEIDDMNLSDLIDLLITEPTLLKLPIIVSDKEVVVGFNKEQINIFKQKRTRLRAI